MSNKKKRKPDPYDIAQIYTEMELFLIASMARNLNRHQLDELEQGFTWEMWQQVQLQNLRRFRRENRRAVKKSGEAARRASERQLKSAGGSNAKVRALIEAITKDQEKIEHAVLRYVDDVYRQTIFKAQVYLDSGTMTLKQAVDMATKDFLDKGINCIEYVDGRRVNVASYAEMALRTASQRATFMADGEKRDRWGIYTIFVSAHANACNWCLPWQGKVLIDDVYSKGKRPRDGNYPLLSEAMEANLLHPNCRHTLATWFPGITKLPNVPDEALARANYEAEQKQRYMERQIRKWKRREAGSLDPENQQQAAAKVKEWQGKIREHLKENPQLRRDYWRERLLPEPELKHVGKIDLEKYQKAASDPILTDEVVLTKKALDHIKDKHPEVMPILEKHAGEIVQNPDVIFVEERTPNTANVLKKITVDKSNVHVVLRLAVAGDNPSYKNSIITAMKINEKRFERYLRTKNIIYKNK